MGVVGTAVVGIYQAVGMAEIGLECGAGLAEVVYCAEKFSARGTAEPRGEPRANIRNVSGVVRKGLPLIRRAVRKAVGKGRHRIAAYCAVPNGESRGQ